MEREREITRDCSMVVEEGPPTAALSLIELFTLLLEFKVSLPSDTRDTVLYTSDLHN